MKILLVMMAPVENLSSAVLRTLAVVKGLVDLNHDVTILCLENASGSTYVNVEKYKFLKDVKIIRIPQSKLRDKIWTDPKKTTLKARIVNVLRKVYHSLFILGSTENIAKNVKIELLEGEIEYEYVISSSDPKTAHIAVRQLISQGLRYNRWVQYWGDPLAYDMTKNYIYPRCIVKMIERRLIGNADKVVYVSPFTLDLQKKSFKNLVDKMFFLPIPYIEKKESLQERNEKFVISYIGAYNSKVRDIMPLYEALVTMGDSIEAYIVGDTDLNLQETSFIHVLPRGDADEIEKKSDLIVCVLNKSGTQIPGKIYHSAATDKAILIVLDGEKQNEMRIYFEKYKRFYMCENELGSISNAILEISEKREKFKPSDEFAPSVVASALIEERSMHN
ncbi:MAG: hypothetical protein J6B50_11310 [Lachnospiraceae bacterium]|nr:hypothetical protein [Lachnospiraceae bacterium]MBP3595257.1 hypothetical protein [Lachnospiraceae bacterium]